MLSMFLMTINWNQIITMLIAFVTGGGLLSAIMEWRYRKLNKKQKTAKTSSESYLDYEKVIDSSTIRLETLRSKIDKLYDAMDVVKKINGVMRMKLFEYRQYIKMLDIKFNLREEEGFQEFFKSFDSDSEYDSFDIIENNENSAGKQDSVPPRNEP